MTDKNIEIPFQIEYLIKQMLDKKENIYIRGNFRVRLDLIRTAINDAIRKYDGELTESNKTQSYKKRKSG